MTVLLRADFNHPDGTPLNGLPLEGGTWTAHADWTCQDGKARMYSPMPAFRLALADATAADYAGTVAAQLLQPRGGFAARWTDDRNGWLATVISVFQGTELRLMQIINGRATVRANSRIEPTAPYNIYITCNGTDLVAEAAGVQIGYSSDWNIDATLCGMCVAGGREPQFDDFEVIG